MDFYNFLILLYGTFIHNTGHRPEFAVISDLNFRREILISNVTVEETSFYKSKAV